ncbi:carboxypeptidase-like regulatory domain-containing protein [Haliscomenobacter sp.]|uniref:T9SS type A sorting domain-containing protein n=1 Tax=Haliscomenobacter sp. TaxID=2717303 RepID=UPI003BA8DB89
MKKMYFLGLISLWGITLAGQVTLNWQITDEQNRPLTGVSVWRQQTVEGTITDENGRFSLSVVPGMDVLEMSYLGFERRQIKIQPDVKENSTELLFPVEYDLPEVSIVAYSYVNRRCCLCYCTRQVVKLDSILVESFVKPNVRVYPIPTQHQIFLQQETPLGQIDLYNLNGQKLQSFNFSDQLNASIDLSAWPAGTYFLRSSKGWVEKVILQKQ